MPEKNAALYSILVSKPEVVTKAKECIASTYSIAQQMTRLLNSLEGQIGSIRALEPFEVKLTSQ